MLVFITTIRHPLNSTSYARVEQLLDATLKSVCRQSDQSFRVVVVHNQRPRVTTADERVHFVEVGFPAPSKERTARIEFAAHLRDKGTKYAVGISAARQMGADHVMFFDADDFLSRGLARWANEHRGHPGWYSSTGYIHTSGTGRVQFVQDGFHLKNGSTSILRSDLTGIPMEVTPSSSQEQIIEASGLHTIDELLGKHGGWQDHLAPAGHRMDALPFPAAIWEIGTGENHSGNLVSGRVGARIDTQITAEFGLKRPSIAVSSGRRLTIALERAARKVRGR